MPTPENSDQVFKRPDPPYGNELPPHPIRCCILHQPLSKCTFRILTTFPSPNRRVSAVPFRQKVDPHRHQIRIPKNITTFWGKLLMLEQLHDFEKQHLMTNSTFNKHLLTKFVKTSVPDPSHLGNNISQHVKTSSKIFGGGVFWVFQAL